MTRRIALNPHWDYADFHSRALQISQQLQQDKINAVALWFTDSAQFSCALLACLHAKIPVFLPPNMLDDSQQWLKQRNTLLLTEHILTHYGTSQKIQSNDPLVDKTNTTPIYLKTSGSSGVAKIICKTAQQMWREAKALAQMLPFKTQSHYVIGSVSIQHLYGLTFRVFLPLELGWILGREQLVYPEYLIAESRQFANTIWITSPTLLTHLNLENFGVKNIVPQGIISSGGALPIEIGQNIRTTLNVPLVEIYGSTETGVIAMRQNCHQWFPLPTCQIGINANDHTLWVKSDWLSQREQTADVVELTENGFHLLGRIDRVVKLGDKRISLTQVEQSLLSHQWVKDCYLAPHNQHSQRILAWIALSISGQEAYQHYQRKYLIKTLKQHLQQIETLALPRYWRFCTQLPRNSQSKINLQDFNRICLAEGDEL